MSAATQRISVLVTPGEKDRIVQKASEAGLSVGELFRRAVTAFQPAEDESLLEGMIDQMNKTAARANLAIDAALAAVEASNRRIEAMERRAQPRKAA